LQWRHNAEGARETGFNALNRSQARKPKRKDTMNNLIENLKNNNQDHEFYPTTTEIINKVISDLKNNWWQYHNKCSSILDIGAGNGKVLKAISEIKDREGNNVFYKMDCYAIEKSEILRGLLDDDIYVIGTDFLEQSLIDKTIDCTFCNPPYSEYETWATKIIRESASKVVYLVIPRRWTESHDIKEAIKYRDAKYKTIGEFSFEDAEDRSARAIVNLIRFDLSTETDDAFDRFFDLEFGHLKSKFEEEKKETSEGEEEEKDGKFGSLVLGKNYVKSLVEMYKTDMDNIRKNYEAVGKLDINLMKEFDIKPPMILKLLKDRLNGLKKLYWSELLSKMSEITDRLISKKRKQLFDTFNDNGHVDFTESNIYAVVIWILKNASDYIDAQLIEVYEEAISKANCRNYKSNTRVFEYDRWRYNENKPSHVYLEYRIVLEHTGRIERSWSGDRYSLSEMACEYIKDILTIANNLGFKCQTSDGRLWHYSREKYWFPGKPQEFRCIYKSNNEVLMEVKAHLNGNIHVRFNQKFALALNVEYGRLKGWIHSGKHAAEEMSDNNAAQYFKSNFTLLPPAFMMIEGPKEETITPEPQPEENHTCEQLSFFNT
jgi:hypothetical protein